MREREAKLAVAAEFQLPDLAGTDGMVAEPQATRLLRTVYYDTPDLRLARWRVSLRWRDGEGWTVKLPGTTEGAALVREEVVFEGDSRRPPDEALGLLRGFLRGEQVAPVVRLRTERLPVELRDQAGTRLAELTDDRVRAFDGRRLVHRWREVEVELAAPEVPVEALAGVVARLQAGGARTAEVPSKYLQALAHRELDPPEVVVARLGRRATVAELVSRDLSASVQRLISNDPGVRLGTDPESVHQARVATRRLRSSLRTFASLLDPGWTSRLRAEAKWLADRLGAVRDADVLLERLQGHAARLPEQDAAAARELLDTLVAERAAARSHLLAALDEERYLRLLDDLIDAARAPAVLEGAAPAAAALPPLAAKAWRKLRREVRGAGRHPTDDQLHQVRIRAKRCRYAAEAVEPIVGKPARRFAKAVAALQEVLGDQHDAVVAEAWVRAAARAAPPRAGLAAGELIAMERAAAAEGREQWRLVWQALDRKQLRTWL